MSILSRVTDLVLPRRDNTTPAPTFPNFGELWNYVTMNGNTYPLPQFHQTLHGEVEELNGGFESLVTRAFMSNPIVFGAEVRRLSAFSQVRFQWRNVRDGRTFGDGNLAILERPWTGGVTGDLLTRLLLFADFAGTGIVLRSKQNAKTYSQLRVPRPDWCTLVMGSDRNPDDPAIESDAELLAVLYHPGGPRNGGGVPEVFGVGEFAIFAPIPDPLAKFRGVPWPAVAAQEISGDTAMSTHKKLFLANGATPNMVVTLDPTILQAEYDAWVEEFKRQEPTGTKAFKTLYLGAGAKVDVVGVDFKNLELAATQGATETRISVASGVPAVIIGNSEGLSGSSLNEGNFKAAKHLFVDLTVRSLWWNACASLESIAPAPGGAELWYDDKAVAFLREDAKDRADIWSLQSQSYRTLIDAGAEHDSVIAALLAEDWSLLKHTGLFSVQLQPPGTTTPEPAPTEPPPDPNAKRDSALFGLLDAANRRAAAIEDRVPVAPVINVTPAPITVNTPEQPVTVTIERGAVEVSAPVTVEPAQVHVTTPEVLNEITVEPTPVEISVEPTPVTVESPTVEVRNEINVEPTPLEVSVEAPSVQVTNEIEAPAPKRTRVERDAEGRITGSTEEPV